MSYLRIRGARTHHLQSLDIDIPLGELVVVTGPSGSGKSSLAFDTVFAEGQRRLVGLLSPGTRKLAQQLPRPDVDLIEGLPPTLACEQSAPHFGPFASVGSALDLTHPLAMLFVRAGSLHCPHCDLAQVVNTIPKIVDRVMALPDRTRFVLSVSLAERGNELWERCRDLQRDGFSRLEVDGDLVELADVQGPIVADDIRLQIDRLVRKEGIESRLADSLELALRVGGGRAWIHPQGHPAISLGTGGYCHACGCELPVVTPALLTLRSVTGRCAPCGGLGERAAIDRETLVPNPELSLREGAIAPWANPNHAFFAGLLEDFCGEEGVDIDTPWAQLSRATRGLVFDGRKDSDYRGVVHDLERRLDRLSSDKIGVSSLALIEPYLAMTPCADCGGTGLSQAARAVRLAGQSIADIYAASLDALPAVLRALVSESESEQELAGRLTNEMNKRIEVACGLGLGYLPLGRRTRAISAGEAQRLRLAEILSSNLAGILFVLDEPTAGLHAQERALVLELLRRVLTRKSSLLVVEHDRMLIEASDQVIDMGPLAGKQGGQVMSQGSAADLHDLRGSLTGDFLSGRRHIEREAAPAPSSGFVRLEGASVNNLKSVDLTVPIGKLTCLVGVSGAGKTSLLLGCLSPALAGWNGKGYGSLHTDTPIERSFEVVGQLLVRSPRSTPSTYTGLSDVIRDLYAKLPESRARGFTKTRFSTNTAGGRCVTCKGDGHLRVGQDLFADIYVPCGDCGGRRFDRQTLQVRFRGLDIAALHELSVDEACAELAAIPKAIARLRALQKVGLGYLQLGQPATSLSGGEIQRLVLARELGKSAAGHCVYLIDEASLGLHWHDLQLLLNALRELTDAGHTVLLADHHLDLIGACDHLVELGPAAGQGGGHIIASGSPSELAAMDTPTGRALAGATERG